ncbi:MAG: hypothetical protein U0269_34880 [Polyangiales bacterium]
MQPQDPQSQLAQLNKDAQLWLIIAAVSIPVGVSIIAGPLAWVKGRQLRSQVRALGFTQRSTADATITVAAVATILSLLAVLAIALVVLGIMFSPTY